MVLNPVISKLSGKLVVLASASPRRLEILTNVGLRFEVVPSWFKETLDKRLFSAPHEYAVETAKQKALEVAKRMPLKHLKTPDIVIGADTIVTVDGLILEKPVDKQDAYRMLSRLSGKEHSVFTGVAIVLCQDKEDEEVDYQLIDFYEETKVKFADLSEDMLWEYINSGEPMDKAGGYGIQALGGMLVEYVHGDFLNVVGFPLNHFCKQLDLLYNRPPSSLDLNGPPTTHSSTQTTPTLANPPPANVTNHSPPASPAFTSSTANPSPPESPSLSSPPANQAHHGPQDSQSHSPPANLVNHSPPSGLAHNSPTSSPAHKVKKEDGVNSLGDVSWTQINSLSKCSENREVNLHGGDGADPVVASRGPVNSLNQVEQGEGESSLEDPHLQKMIELMDGFKASKALFTASKLRVFDVLEARPGQGAVEVAQEIQASVKGTERLLEACVSLGLLDSHERLYQKPVYENTDMARRFLLSHAPHSLQGYIQHCNELVWPLFTHLEGAVRDGTNQHERAFGKKSDNLFQDAYYSRHEVKLRFMNAMHSIAKVTGGVVATAFDLSGFKTACDLGGCTGAMAYEFTKANPGMTVTVFDLPAVIEMSGHFRPVDIDSRVSFVTGDFFKDALPKADLYILGRILHDWTDEKVHALLSKISDACAPGSAVLVAETMLDGQTPYSCLQSLNMLVQTEGRERTQQHYSDLLSANGFGAVRVTHTGSFLDVIIALKK
ncbi:probable bifunctional dTTP/UTP pyrophosphatase/methyltransferase protein isoform X4 [Hypomesus transpacificus]|uniref:probable bifunctional dTTP/UTP pyrophosphatase/methyltransferase protein isoform X4 n=1 Tax=Hypomesus transpacificus TaxID=137520 RepID=UPI001F087817|nr:probable bifunctional dTTP/UTP pyrophosphatase/methyltransferase protein isoform X4 [Hypomesus transpacificus]